MKILLVVLILVAVLPVSSESCQYIVFRGGPGWASDADRTPNPEGGSVLSFTSEFDLNLAYGHSFSNWLRAEVELGYVNMGLEKMYLKKQEQDVDLEGSDTHLRGMINVFLDWRNSTGLTPFIGLGAGMARANLDMKWELPNQGSTAETESSDYTFTWQAIAGAGWLMNSSWEIELMYRYYVSNDRTHDNHDIATYPEVEVEGTKAGFVQVGIRYLI